MKKQLLFNFKTAISSFDIPSELNNPFGVHVPEIAKIAAEEFQDFITMENDKWNYNFHTQKGKMFGVLVVQNQDKTYSYLGTVSGKLPGRLYCERFIPSVFDDSIDDFFINRGMTELTRIGDQIKKTENPSDINELKEKSRLKSIAIQKQLFENYNFLNLSGKEENLLDIFKNSSHGKPPVAAGECAAPKLLQYAIEHKLKPIAIAEFWWGSPIKKNGKKHKAYYPACKDRCRPILEYMLEDTTLFNSCQ